MKRFFSFIIFIVVLFLGCVDGEKDNIKFNLYPGSSYAIASMQSLKLWVEFTEGSSNEIFWYVDSVLQNAKGKEFIFNRSSEYNQTYVVSANVRGKNYNVFKDCRVLIKAAVPGVIISNPQPIRIRKGNKINLTTELLKISAEEVGTFNYSWTINDIPFGMGKTLFLDTNVSEFLAIAPPYRIAVVATNGVKNFSDIVNLDVVNSGDVLNVVVVDKIGSSIVENSIIEKNYSELKLSGGLLFTAKLDPAVAESPTWRYVWRVNGSIQSENRKNFSFDSQSVKSGLFEIKVKIDDEYDGYSNEYAFNIKLIDDVGERVKPIVSIVNGDLTRLVTTMPEEIEFTTSVIDNSGDTITYKWFLDNLEKVGETLDKIKINFPATVKNYSVKVVASNNVFTSDPAIVNVYVIEVPAPENPKVEFLKPGSNSQEIFDYSVDFGTATKNIYFIFTNSTNSPQAGMTLVNHNVYPTVYPTYPVENITENGQFSTNTAVSDFNNGPHIFETKKLSEGINYSLVPNLSQVGDSRNFDISTEISGPPKEISCKLKKIISENTKFGTKTVEFWVADNQFGVNGARLDISAVENLSNKFLKADFDNDIYDYVTNIVGEEWGDHQKANLVEDKDKIVILIFDIDENAVTAGIAGYFYSRDNYKKSTYSKSNEEIMFYLDSYYLKNRFDDAVSTLAHEFQHMIFFYQKTVKAGFVAVIEAWYNEMCAMAVEDFLSEKMAIIGPRGIVGTEPNSIYSAAGRVPYFIAQPNRILTEWSTVDVLYSYAHGYVFGAYLTRNFGGAPLVSQLVQSSYQGQQGVTEAVKIVSGYDASFKDLFIRFAVAAVLSKNVNEQGFVKFNNGATFFSSSANGANYNLGSINFHNFKQVDAIPKGIKFLSSINNLTIKSMSNEFYREQNITGAHTWTITLPANISMTVVKD